MAYENKSLFTAALVNKRVLLSDAYEHIIIIQRA